MGLHFGRHAWKAVRETSGRNDRWKERVVDSGFLFVLIICQLALMSW